MKVRSPFATVLTSLQYRHRLEFAIGRTCSADWDTPDPLTRRTTGVRTTWIPISETPRTEARPDDRVLSDMLGLADALACFRFMNRVMADQRTHSEVVRLRAEDDTLTVAAE